MNPSMLSNEVIVLILAVGGLFAFGKNIVQAVLQLHAYGQTKKGQAALQVATLLVGLMILLVMLSR